MRWLALVLFAGCATSGRLETATRNAQACEYQREQVKADADRLRASALTDADETRAQNARAWADRIDVDCRRWRDEVALEQGRLDAASANSGAMQRVLAQPSRRQRSVSCTSQTIGTTTFTDCN